MKRAGAATTREGSAVEEVSVRLKGETGAAYNINVGAGLLESLGDATRDALSTHARRAALVSNAHVFELYGKRAVAALESAGFRVSTHLVGDGERFKTLRTAARVLDFLSQSGVGRSDAVVALGGGVVGDVAGFAAALHLRGVPFVQAPTTLLAQIDSSVGGKTGVNTPAGKNLVGAFHQPRAVVIDTDTLATLPRRELTAGWCEAVKQAAVAGPELFALTVRTLTASHGGGSKALAATVPRLIAAQCSFKAKIVAGDEREDASREDARSRRVLNFGHTVGHALEHVTGYRRFRHGEAVGYGVVAAAEISARLGMLARAELESLREAVRLAGRLPRADDLDAGEVLAAAAGDKKAVAGSLRWVLLEGIGRPRIVNGANIPASLLRAAVRASLRQ